MHSLQKLVLSPALHGTDNEVDALEVLVLYCQLGQRLNNTTRQQWCCVKHFPTCHWVFECDTRVDTKVNTLELMLQPFTMNLRKRDSERHLKSNSQTECLPFCGSNPSGGSQSLSMLAWIGGPSSTSSSPYNPQLDKMKPILFKEVLRY